MAAIKALRGMKDILPPQSDRFIHFLEVASKTAEKYGFKYIETPILEETALFLRSVGESSDIVGKEMYRFRDKGGNDVCLRPEGTAGVVRSFIEHKLDRQEGVYRFYYHGPMFRYERPQKGRLREFHQFGCETFNEPSVYEDATMISMIGDIFDNLGIEYEIRLNSLGCRECLPNYKNNLVNFLDAHVENLCEDCLRRKDTNPIRVLDCKNPHCNDIYKKAPHIHEHLCENCKDDFEKLRRLLQNSGIEFIVDPYLVRGLDYYTKSAFEFVSRGLGAQNAIAGGGRFDNLVEFMGGRPTPAIGFAIGIERVLELMREPDRAREGVYVGAMIPEALDFAFEVSLKLKKLTKTESAYRTKSLKAHLKAADKAMCRYALIIGEEELSSGKVWVKDLTDKREKTVEIDRFIAMLGE